MTQNPRIWALNGDFVALKPTGVPRYAREVTLALDTLIGEGHPLTEGLSLDMVAPAAADDLDLRHIPVRVVPEFRSPRLPQVWTQLQLPRHVEGGLVSFCNLAPVALTRHIVCIHDLHTRLMPESYGRGFRLAHRVILPALGRRARRITTVSELSREHLIAHGVAPADKITVTYNGADHAARWDAAASTLETGPRPFVLCLGQNQKYKNMELVWRIAPKLGEMGLDVYVAGGITAEPGARPANLRLLGRISDADLASTLDSALCFLLPSRIEGFGIPAVEAMVRGCPVVAADAPSLPEICGDGALFAGPDDPQAWIDAIARLQANHALRREMAKRGSERAKRYTWRGIAESYLRLMAEVDDVEKPSAGNGTGKRSTDP